MAGPRSAACTLRDGADAQRAAEQAFGATALDAMEQDWRAYVRSLR